MQTFLPYPDFEQSAKCLDRARLGKQRIEVVQLLKTLLGISNGWKNHPACKMWKGYEAALAQYGLAICTEWISRGYRDQQRAVIEGLIRDHGLTTVEMPHWLNDARIQDTHRSALIMKAAHHYAKQWPGHPYMVKEEGKPLPYYWPEGKQSN